MAFLKYLLIGTTLGIHSASSKDLQIPLPKTSHDSSSLIHDILVQNEVIGDVLSDFEPSISLSLYFPASHESVHLGNDIPVSSVDSPPVFEVHPFNGPHLTLDDGDEEDDVPFENLTYTLALTDPDAKSRSNPKWAEMAHWIITNLTLIPSTSSSSSPSSTPNSHPRTYSISSTISLTSAQTLLDYLPPTPPPGTGPHRYIFVLMAGSAEKSAKLIPPGPDKKKRRHWGYSKGKGKTERVGVERWADEMGLRVVGVNFFFARDAGS